MASRSTITPQTPYAIAEHSHRFAAWAAGRAASVNGNRFKVELGVKWLEACGMTAKINDPSSLPVPSQIDQVHREWRAKLRKSAEASGRSITHGVAAKLINVYLKSRFVCSGYHKHPNVAALHPPIDRLLLNQLSTKDFTGQAKKWRAAANRGWSKFDCDEYESVISAIRDGLGSEPMWKIEMYWVGYQ